MPRIYLSPPDIRSQDHASVEAVLTSNWVAPVGPHLNAFEDSLKESTGRAAAVALNSGTAALHLALLVLGVEAGDRVICPSLTFAASANPICYCGAEPVFIDSEATTWNMDPELLAGALKHMHAEGALPKAVVVVHLYGQCAQMDAILGHCAQYGVPVIEDAAEALGASFLGRPAGSMGVLSFFSFNGNKIITTSGGGMLLGDDVALIERARYLSTQAREPVRHYEHKAIGYNYRLSNVLAGLGQSQFADLDRRVVARRAHFEAYSKAFADMDGVTPMPIQEVDEANYWLSCFLIDSAVCGVTKDAVIDALEAVDIEARPIWKPLHLQPVFKDVLMYGGECAESLYAQGICLPSGSSMSEADRARVIEVVRTTLKSGKRSA